MIFICTCSQDSTTSLLVPRLGEGNVFRFDIDRPEDFTWDFSPSGFNIARRSGGQISNRDLTLFYLRKPMYFTGLDVPAGGCLEDWRRKETQELFEDFYRECESRNMTTLVHSRSAKYGKLRQMIAASKYFRVPPWHLFHGLLPEETRSGRWVAKTLTGTPVGKDKVLFVKEIDPAQLDLSYPWFLQQRIDGTEEVTVLFCNGSLYAARLARAGFEGVDSRRPTFERQLAWPPCELSPSEKSAIRGFMAETGYSFGRFDFIRKDGELWFLELNPNGQWAWLDPKDEHGLVTRIVDAIQADDRRSTSRKSRVRAKRATR